MGEGREREGAEGEQRGEKIEAGEKEAQRKAECLLVPASQTTFSFTSSPQRAARCPASGRLRFLHMLTVCPSFLNLVGVGFVFL